MIKSAEKGKGDTTPIGFLERTTVEMQPKYLSIIGIICVIAYTLLRPNLGETAKIFSTIGCLLSFWTLYKYGRAVQSHLLFRFVWAATTLQLLTWGLSILYTPEWAVNYPKLDYLIRWLIFIPFAWWIAQYKNGIWLVWGAAALSILVSPWTTGYGLQEILDGAINGKRIDFGLRNAQHTTMFFSIILIGLCCFSHKLVKKHKLFIIPILLLVIYCTSVILASESRQSWLALVIAAFLVSLYACHQSTKHLQLRIRLLTLIAFLAVIFTFLYSIANTDRIAHRIHDERNVMQKLEHFNVDQIPYSSIGIRIHSWVNALDYIKQKPLFGWGSNGQKIAMTKTIWPPNTIGTIDHLHSHYVETLTNFGVVGLLFYFSIWVVVGRCLFRQIKTKNIETEIGYFFLAVCIFWGVICFFESYLSMWTGVYYFNIFMAGVVGKIWNVTLNNERESISNPTSDEPQKT